MTLRLALFALLLLLLAPLSPARAEALFGGDGGAFEAPPPAPRSRADPGR